MNLQLLDDAVAGALCPVFQALTGAGSLVSVFGPAFGPGGMAASQAAIPVTQLSLLGAFATCEAQQIGPDPNNGLEVGCTKTDGEGGIGYELLNVDPPQNGPVALNAKQILSVELGYDNFGLRNWVVTYLNTTGVEDVGYGFPGTAGGPPPPQRISLVPFDGSNCTGNDPIVPVPDYPDIPDHIYTDPITNCTYNVTFQGLIRESETAMPRPVFEISSIDSSLTRESRNSGGVIGGCNFEPVIYTPGTGGPGGPIPPIPTPPFPPGPDNGVPWWAGPLLAGATAAGTNLVLQELAKLFAAKFNEAQFTLTAPCDVDAECIPLERTWEFGEATFQERINAQQVAILEVLQQHLNWKTPICYGSETPDDTANFRTISFRSVSTSPYGNSRLRKRFRYRSSSGLELGQVVDYWKDFSFQSGGYRVRHTGTSWGNLEVWAASEDEGKRVIRHAAGEAGIDPDKCGRWSTRRSNSSRLGVSDTMKIDTTGGYYWITSRDGSDARPIVALISDQ